MILASLRGSSTAVRFGYGGSASSSCHKQVSSKATLLWVHLYARTSVKIFEHSCCERVGSSGGTNFHCQANWTRLS